MSCLRVQNLRCTYPGGAEALRGVSFEVKEAELFGFVGPDGAGKTTLIKILAGLVAHEGAIEAAFSPDEVGYIPQRFSLYTDLSVRENVDFFRGLYPRHERSRDPEELLDFIGLARFQDRLAGALSGGMKQKLALVCALVHGPKVLLMDEPTVGVDPVSRREFLSLVFELQKEGLTVVSSTPYMDEAEQFDRVVLLHEGRILLNGTVDELRGSVDGVVMRVYADDPLSTQRRALKLDYIRDAQLFGDRVHVFLNMDPEQASRRLSHDLELPSSEIERAEYSIEDIFLIQTGEQRV